MLEIFESQWTGGPSFRFGGSSARTCDGRLTVPTTLPKSEWHARNFVNSKGSCVADPKKKIKKLIYARSIFFFFPMYPINGVRSEVYYKSPNGIGDFV